MSAYTLFANAFLAVGGFVVALFAVFGALCLILRGYLAFLEWSFTAADKFWRECHRPTLPRNDEPYSIAHGDWPANPECVDALHRSGGRP